MNGYTRVIHGHEHTTNILTHTYHIDKSPSAHITYTSPAGTGIYTENVIYTTCYSVLKCVTFSKHPSATYVPWW